MAAARGQTLAQMAISWVLRDVRVTSALMGPAASGSSRRTSPRRPAPCSPRRNSPGSTGTRSRPASTSGPPPARG